ncbi:MAG: glutamate synthase large subunit [Actinobacteria bacterium]|nr:glutamate synthase large subunit [Actinomycetota bacterium]
MTELSGPFGLYHPGSEHDSCGVAFVASLSGEPTHQMIDLGITALENLHHRGASGAESNTGDGAGILMQIPHRFFSEVAPEAGIELPAPGMYGAGMAFLPTSTSEAASVQAAIEKLAIEEGLEVLGWRDVPICDSTIGTTARQAMPRFRQVFIASGKQAAKQSDKAARKDGRNGTGTGGGLATDPLGLERALFCLRKRAEHEIEGIYFPSLSTRTLVYKGMLTAHQLRELYPDLADQRMESAMALVHSRFSTNTFPSWSLAHPYRYLAHNGEINTLMGNRNWMRAREALLESDLIPGELSRLFPICTPGASDSASFDEVLELLHIAGRSLPHAVLMMIPEAWEHHQSMSAERKAFYRFHSALMEPWDGPAAVAFTDGTVIGAVLDRNGLRPARYWVTSNGLVVMASEVGVLDIDPATIVRKGRLQPGKMFLVDLAAHRIVDDDEIKAKLAGEHPYGKWLEDGQVLLEDLPARFMLTPQHASVVDHQRLFGYTDEELRLIVAPMAKTGAEANGSMGSDTPVAVLSERPRLLFDYFTQLFAQVTNPPLDAIREELVTSLSKVIGPEANLLRPCAQSCKQIVLDYPVLDNDALAKLLYVNEHGETPGFKTFAVDGLFEVDGGGEALKEALQSIRRLVSRAIADGANLIVLSDRHSDERMAPIPSLLLTAGVHHHLVLEKTRTRVGLLVECGDAREVHHMALLLGYGAAAVNPYLVFESIEDMIATGRLEGVTPRQAITNYIKAASKGVLKVMSKMGISTVASYTGAQVFEAIGLSREIVDEYFTGTASRIGGIGLDVLAAEVAARHRLAHLSRPSERAHRELEVGGEYQWRREGEYHLFNPRTVFKLQHATRSRRYEIFKEYTSAVDDQARRLATLRGLLRLKTEEARAVPLEEVEPVSEIVKRFATGAMSYGSISAEAHETLAVAMNRIGGKSNTGEGGEDPRRFSLDPNGDSRRSAIKQVASGRFGVTSEYLVSADDIQIKMAQGAKPGEGGQLPGKKVYPWIAQVRHSTPGVGLISPPPHHDIYSIEDLAQLIYDLKNANPKARIHVKLVAELGVGTVAAGVAKAHADVVLISGHDGGTGAAPLTSIKHAGAPWELGLAETQQTLVLNGLRDRIVVQVDGQMKTGRDVMIAALLGAEEFGFATAPLVVMGCVMMRVCHLDTCPVGIATQNPELRRRFAGKPEFVTTFFEFLAEEVRELLASLGLRSIEEAVGRVDLLDTSQAISSWKASGLDLAPVLEIPRGPYDIARHKTVGQDHGLEKALDVELIQRCAPALERKEKVALEMDIRNVNRTVGTMLGFEVTRRYGASGLPDGTIELSFSGSAGQSFGAFLPAGISMTLEGDANDYFGKGLSGGRLVLFPPRSSPFKAEEQIIAGNVVLYGATGGEAFIRGQVGERFCVRNSGALAVVEGVGDHGCEYMTGGRAVVLGATGRNFGAGMSGGIAYVLDPDRSFASQVNQEMVALEVLTAQDIEWLEAVVSRHGELTGSAVATRLLKSWRSASALFTKVMPRDYRRVMEATARARAEGTPVEVAVMAAAHG